MVSWIREHDEVLSAEICDLGERERRGPQGEGRKQSADRPGDRRHQAEGAGVLRVDRLRMQFVLDAIIAREDLRDLLPR